MMAADFTVGGLKYRTASLGCYVIGSTDANPASLTIPATVDYNGQTLDVMGIKAQTFSGRSSLKSVTIADGPEDFFIFPIDRGEGNYHVYTYEDPFEGCQLDYVYYGRDTRRTSSFDNAKFYYFTCPIREFVIGNSVKKINVTLLEGVSTLERFTIGNSVTSVAANAFAPLQSVGTLIIAAGENQPSVSSTAGFNPTHLDEVIINSTITSLNFMYGSTVKKLVVGPGCTAIPSFGRSKSLKEVIFEDGETPFNFTASFTACDSLTYLYLGRNVASTSSYNQFQSDRGIASLKTLVIGDKVTTLPRSIFENSAELEDITFGKGLATIDREAFMNCKKLKALELPASLQSIGRNAFYGCSALESLKIPDSPLVLGEQAFVYCSSLVDVELGQALESISTSCFLGCVALKDIRIPASVKEISTAAFKGCSSLANVVIEDCNESISLTEPFTNCDSLTYLYLGRNVSSPSSSKAFQSDRGIASLKTLVIGDMVTTLPSSIFENSAELEDITFGQGLVMIESEAFMNCKKLKALELPVSLQSIARNAFYGCSALESLKLPDSPLVLGEQAFVYCSSLVDVELGQALESIPTSCFLGCVALKDIRIPASVKEISTAAFKGCSSLANVVIEDSDDSLSLTTPFANCTSLDYLYLGRNIVKGTPSISSGFFMPSVQGIASLHQLEIGDKVTSLPEQIFMKSTALESVSMGKNVASIEASAFSGCSSLKSVSFSENLISIGDEAFKSCDALASVTLPDNLTSIGESAFYSCDSLSDVSLSEKLESIQIYAFAYCNNLDSVVIPASVKMIDRAFVNCENLSSVIIEDGNEPLSIHTPFTGSDSITTLYMGRNLEKPASTSYFFTSSRYGLEPLKTLIVGDSVTALADQIFRLSTSLEKIYLGQNVKSIGDGAFSSCNAIDSIYVNMPQPAVCASTTAFSSQAYSGAVLKVPTGKKKAYRTAEVWQKFANIVSDGALVTITYDHACGQVTINGQIAEELLVDEDEPLEIAVTPAEGYAVAAIIVNDEPCALTDGKLRFDSVDENLDVKIDFAIITFSITLPEALEGGRIEVNPDSAVIDYGARLEITPVADRGHELTALSVNGVDVLPDLNEAGSYVIEKVTGDISLAATFSPIPYRVVATSNQHGHLTLNGEADSCRVVFGQPLVIEATPAGEGRYLQALYVDGVDVTSQLTDGRYVIPSVEADVAVEAVFAIYTYTIRFSCEAAHGTITPGADYEGDALIVEYGSDAVFFINPAEGYEVASVLLDGKDATAALDPSGKFVVENVRADHTLSVVFDIRRIRLAVLGLEGGLLTMLYDYGTEASMLVEAAEGWEFHSLTCGSEVMTDLGAGDVYTTGPLTDDTYVSVVFRLATQTAAGQISQSLVTVSAYQQTVTIAGADDDAQICVFDTAGALVYRGDEHIIHLNRTGVFIVTVDDQTFKVML